MLLYLPPCFRRFSSTTRRPASFRLARLASRGAAPSSTSDVVRVWVPRTDVRILFASYYMLLTRFVNQTAVRRVFQITTSAFSLQAHQRLCGVSLVPPLLGICVCLRLICEFVW